MALTATLLLVAVGITTSPVSGALLLLVATLIIFAIIVAIIMSTQAKFEE